MSKREMTLKEAMQHVQDTFQNDANCEILQLMFTKQNSIEVSNEDADKFMYGIAFMMQFIKALEKEKKIKTDKVIIKY